MARKKKKPRTVRRARARKVARLVADQAKLARLEVGGSPERPLDVASASLVEPVAIDLRCPHCEGLLRVESHDAVVVDERPLRRVRLACPACGGGREVWIRVVSPDAHLN